MGIGSCEVLIARQPIMTPGLEVVGWELLYRQAPTTTASEGIRATARIVVDGLMELGRDLRGEGEVYLNVPHELFEQRTLLDVPTEGIVLEVLEDVTDVAGMRPVLEQHRAAGFRLALDDLVPDDPRLELAELVDVCKVDLQAPPLSEALALTRSLAGAGHTVLAEKVETAAERDRSVAAGATLLQGYLLARPSQLRGFRPTALASAELELLRVVREPELDIGRVEGLIRRDVGLADRFLRLVRLHVGWREVDSIRHGLVLLGHRALTRWVTLLALSAATAGAPGEVLTMAGIRAAYCEGLERLRPAARPLDAFSLGMFSVLGDAGVVPDALLSQLPVSAAVAAGLRGDDCPYRTLLSIPLAAERADFDGVLRAGQQLGLTYRQLTDVQVDALRWGQELVVEATG